MGKTKAWDNSAVNGGVAQLHTEVDKETYPFSLDPQMA